MEKTRARLIKQFHIWSRIGLDKHPFIRHPKTPMKEKMFFEAISKYLTHTCNQMQVRFNS
jgi:hypothetical protein